MTMFTTAVPVWLNVTCGECNNHQDRQLGPQQQLTEDPELRDFTCNECGSHSIGKINIAGKSNKNMAEAEVTYQ